MKALFSFRFGTFAFRCTAYFVFLCIIFCIACFQQFYRTPLKSCIRGHNNLIALQKCQMLMWLFPCVESKFMAVTDGDMLHRILLVNVGIHTVTFSKTKCLRTMKDLRENISGSLFSKPDEYNRFILVLCLVRVTVLFLAHSLS